MEAWASQWLRYYTVAMNTGLATGDKQATLTYAREILELPKLEHHRNMPAPPRGK